MNIGTYANVTACLQADRASALRLSASGQLFTQGPGSPSWLNQQMQPPAGTAASVRQAGSGTDLAWQHRQQQQQQEVQIQQAQAQLQQQQQQQHQQQAQMQQMHMQQLLAQQRQRQETARQQLEQQQLQLAHRQAEQQQEAMLQFAHQQAERQQEALVLQRQQWQQEQQRLHQLRALQLQQGQDSAGQGFLGGQRHLPPDAGASFSLPPSQPPGPPQPHQLQGWPSQPPSQPPQGQHQQQHQQAKVPAPGWPNGLTSPGSAGLPPGSHPAQPHDAGAGQPFVARLPQQNGLLGAPGLPNGAATPGAPPQLASPQPAWDSGWGAASLDQRAAHMMLQNKLRAGSGSAAMQTGQQQDRDPKPA